MAESNDTPERRALVEWWLRRVRASRVAQGLPEYVEDQVAADAVARILLDDCDDDDQGNNIAVLHDPVVREEVAVILRRGIARAEEARKSKSRGRRP